MNVGNAELWDEARHIYSIGLLTLGVVFVGLAVIMLCVLPAVLRVGRQLAQAIEMHANALRHDADMDARIKEMAADVKVIKSDVADIKKAA
ncbi:MAG TPA: hypothetical protein PKA58_37570 [Polyangium sp.]|nr:hypothetical protein [Polyangium sp.]